GVEEVGIAAGHRAEPAADLRALKRMRQPRSREVGLADLDDLGLGSEPAQRGAMQYPGAVPLECAALLVMGVLNRLGREPFGRVPAVVARSPARAGVAHLLSLPPASSSTTARPASSPPTGTRNG